MWWIVVGCAGPAVDDSPSDDLSPIVDSDTGTPPVADLTFVASPILEDPEGMVWLARRLIAETSVPTFATVQIDDGEMVRELTFDARGASHDLMLLGLLGDVEHTVTATFTDDDGDAITEVLTFTPPSPDVVLPHTAVLVEDTDRIQPGYTLLPMRGETTPRLIAAYDPQGRPRWVHQTVGKVFAAAWHPNGLLTALNSSAIIELDAMGNLMHSWVPEGDTTGVEIIGFDDFHHEAVVSPDGTAWTLSKISVPVDAFPISESAPFDYAPATVADDRVVHLARDGSVLHQIDLSAVLPTTRIGFNSLNMLPEGFDWTHANAVWPVEGEDAVLVSSRHQDTVVKIDLDTGTPRWILAPHDGWPESHTPYLLEPIGASFAWAYHQHAPMVDGDRVLMFDNGNFGRRTLYEQTPSAGLWSRVVEFTVDEDAMTVEQTFSWGEQLADRFYSQALGNADYLDNDNIFVTFPYLHKDDGQTNVDVDRGDKSIRLIEIDRTTGDVVWDLQLYSDLAENPDGWYGDRATRVVSLYGPGVTEVATQKR